MTVRRAILALLVAAAGVALSTVTWPLLSLRAQSLTVGNYQLVGETRLTRNVSQYTYRAVLTNPGPALAGATARVTSGSSRTVIVDADLTFAAVPAVGTAASQDTFSFQQDRTFPFNPADLVWTVTPIAANRPPNAIIAPIGPVFVTQSVSLDGRGSSDPDGTPLTYRWSLVSRPTGSGAAINASNSAQATFLPDRAGSYVVRLEVRDGQLTDTEDVTLTTSNSAPRANPGPDQTVTRNTLVTLDGSASFDVDGDPLTYLWSFVSRPAGTSAVLSDATAVRPTFTVDMAGDYRLRLVVSDGQQSSEPDLVVIHTGNSPPVANAGADRTVARGATVQLDGSASSDVDGDSLTYIWELLSRPAGSGAALVGATTSQPTFVADRRGDFQVRLTVSDGQSSAQDTVTITTENTRPVANAGPDRTAPLGSTVTLDGSGSTDVDGDSLTYQWSLVTIPPGSSATLSNPSSVSPTFVADRSGEYVAQLVVNDGLAASNADTAFIGSESARPIADAGANQPALVGTVVLLDGSGSSDPDGDGLRFMWSLTSVPPGSVAMLNDPTSPTPSFVPDQPGGYLVQLIVDDGRLTSVPDTVIITTSMNTPPVANAGPDQLNVQSGTVVTLDGSASSDADAHALTYQWSLLTVPSGSTATLANPTTPQPTFVPDLPGPYVAQLIVNDGYANSIPDTVQVELRSVDRTPVANAGLDRSVAAGSAVVLDGGGSSDPDGDPLTYAWTLISAPSGSTAVLVNSTSATPTLTPVLAGDYVVSLVVNDGFVDSLADTAIVSVTAAQGAPTIAAFTPTSGRVGDIVTVTGTNFVGVQSVAFGGVSTSAFTGLGSTSLTVAVPAGAATGPISVTTAAGSAASAGQFVVLETQDFQLSVTPAVITVASGGHGAFQISVTGTGGFTNLATLAVSGVPAQASAAFVAPTLTTGQSTQLNVQAGTTAGSLALTVTATGLVNNVETTRTASVTLQVAAAGVTSIAGQFLTVSEVPIPNVLVQIGAVQTHSDAAGNFLLQNVPEGLQPLMIDSNVAVAGYPIYKVDLTVVAGQTLTLPPFKITPPPPPERYVPINTVGQTQVVTDARYPGFELTLPAGSRIVGWDGIVKSKVAIERILPSQLPVPPPPGPTNSLYQIHFGTPMGGIPSARLPVTLPNDQGLQPGQPAEIWWYDAAPTGGPGAWKMAGMGTVSQDGTKIVSNPGVGIDRFCGVCGLVCIINRLLGLDNPNKGSPVDADPVDVALGQMVIEKTDLLLPGRIPARVHRTHYPIDPFGSIAGFQLGLGPGWALSVDVVLLEINTSLRRLVLPGAARYDFVLQSDGTFKQGTDKSFAGAVLTSEGSGAHRLRFKNGVVWRFEGTFIAGVDLLVEERDRNGNRLTIERDSNGRIQRVVEPSGRALTFTHAGGRLSQVSDPIGRTVRYGYDAAQRLQVVTDAAGGTTRYSYDSAGRILTVTDAKGIVFNRNEYSPLSGRILRQVEADGSVWQFKYSVLPRVVTPVPQALNPAAVEESTVSIAAGLAGDLRNAPISTTVVDPRGNSRTYTLFAGFGTAITDALGQRTRFEHDAVGQVVRIVDPLGRMTRLEYDARGNVARVINAQGQESAFEYESTFSKVTKITDALGNVTSFEYDARGNLTAVTDPEQDARPEADRRKTRFTYDATGQPITSTDPLGNTTILTFDERGNLTAAADPLGNTTRLLYDAVSRVTTHIDARAHTTTMVYDVLDRLSEMTDALGARTRVAYDPNGNLLSVTDARDNVLRYEYDLMDRLIRRTDPLGRQESFVYDGGGNLTAATDRRGQVARFAYDRLNRRVNSQYADGTTATFRYDGVGRLVSADDSADPHRPVVLTYDNLDRLVAESTALGTVRYRYDALGRRLEMVASGAQPVGYVYDRNSHLRSVGQASLGEAVFDYDANGRRVRLVLPNHVTTEYEYDQSSRLTALLYRNAFGVLGNLSYGYDALGSRTSIGGSLARTELPGEVARASYDAANQQIQFGERQLEYDANGNLVSVADASGLTQFIWDSRNRLVGRSGPNVSSSFAYDAIGRRASKETDGRRTDYTYDGFDFISELTNGTSVTYLRSLFVDEPLVRNGTEHYVADALGSTIALTDGSGGVATRYSYDPFGGTVAAGAPSSNPIQFVGRENDEASLYFYRSRYFSTGLHRFVSEDPLKLLGGNTNLYGYVGNNPLGNTDPMGRDCVSSNGMTTCTTAAYRVRFPTPEGWKDFTSRSPFYHRYTVTADACSSDGEAVQRWVVNHPTPGDTSPATRKGTRNNATPNDVKDGRFLNWLGSMVGIERDQNWVMSYVGVNELNGAQVVINVTTQDHNLFPGIVVRQVGKTSDGWAVSNYGEGTSWAQAPFSPFRKKINDVWKTEAPLCN